MIIAKMHGRVVTSALLLLGFTTSLNASAQSCNVGFNTYSALAALPNQARDSFTYAPYYQETCAPAGTDWSQVYVVSPESYGHYHLGFEDATMSCYNSVSGGFGRMQNGKCVAPPDYAALPRYVATHDNVQVLQMTATSGDQFDLVHLTALAGSAQVNVHAQHWGSYWNYFINQNITYYPSDGNNRWMTGMELLAGPGSTGPVMVDNIVVEPSFSTHPFDTQNSLGYWDGTDWSVGQFKASCEQTRGMSGISTSTASSGRTHSIRCRNHFYWAAYNPNNVTVGLLGGDSRRSVTWGDWDVGYTKAECREDEIVGGVSQNVGDGRLVALSCENTGIDRTYGPGYAASCVARNVGTTASYYEHTDWAYGYYKTECADNEVIKGISRNSTGAVHRVLCCQYPHHVL